MKYYVTLIYIKADGTDDHSTNVYDSIVDAEKAFHQAMVTGIGKDDYVKVNCIVVDSNLEVKFKRSCTK